MAAHKFLFCLGYLVWHTPTPLVTLHIKTNPLPPSTTVTPYLNVSFFLITGKSKNNEVICIKKSDLMSTLFPVVQSMENRGKPGKSRKLRKIGIIDLFHNAESLDFLIR
jgi:hypothetical protein